MINQNIFASTFLFREKVSDDTLDLRGYNFSNYTIRSDLGDIYQNSLRTLIDMKNLIYSSSDNKFNITLLFDNELKK